MTNKENERAAMIGKRLKELRKQKGVTGMKVAEDIGCTKQCLYAYERGQRIPRDPMKYKLAEYYGVGVYELFYDF